MLSCFDYMLLNLPGCPAGTRTAGHASGSIWATDVPGWITAIATAGLLIGAIITARYAIKTFRAQARQIAILVDQNDRDNTERRTAQAARVFIGADRKTGTLVQPWVKNGSDFPIFDAESWESRPGNLRRLKDLGVILPGEDPFAGPQRNRDNALARTILTFRDANNVRWIRMPNGTYHQQTRDTTRQSIEAILAETPLPPPPAPELERNPPGQPDQEQDESQGR